MKSIKHVLWRGALALGLMAVGLGSGLGMPPIERTTADHDCTHQADLLLAGGAHRQAHAPGATVILLRRALSPAR